MIMILGGFYAESTNKDVNDIICENGFESDYGYVFIYVGF